MKTEMKIKVLKRAVNKIIINKCIILMMAFKARCKENTIIVLSSRPRDRFLVSLMILPSSILYFPL